MSFDRFGYVRGKTLYRHLGSVTGAAAFCLMVATSAVEAQDGSKQSTDRPSRLFNLEKITDLLQKQERDLEVTYDMQQWFDAKPYPPIKRSKEEHLQIMDKLQNDIRNQIEPCWSVPRAVKNADELKVGLRVYLMPDGALASTPEIIGRRYKQDEFYRIVAESARRAVQRCAPLKLPTETYDIWRQVEMVFDLGDMLGR